MLSRWRKLPVVLVDLLLLFAFLWFFRIDLVALGTVGVGVLGVDSDQYLSYVGTLLNRHISYDSPVSEFTEATLTRTPGYPLFLVPVVLASDILGSFNQWLVISHAAAWCFAAIVFTRTVGRALGERASFLVFLLACLVVRPFAFQLMSDWLAVMVAAITCCLFWLFIRTKKSLWLLLSIFSASCAVLIRPDYLVLVALVLVGAVVVAWRSPAAQRGTMLWAGLGVIPSLAPLAFLLITNWERHKQLTLIPREGHVYELVSVLGPEPRLDLSLPGRALLEARQGLPKQATNREILETITLEPHALNAVALGNLALMESAHTRSHISWIEANATLAEISAIYIRTYPWRYIFAVLCGISSLVWGLPAYIAIWRSYAINPGGLPAFGILTASFQVLHVCGVATVHIMHARYYLPGACLLLLGALVCVFSMIGPSKENE